MPGHQFQRPPNCETAVPIARQKVNNRWIDNVSLVRVRQMAGILVRQNVDVK